MINYNALQQWLDHGQLKKLAHQSGISYRQALNIVKGRSKNYQFLNTVVLAAEVNKRLAERTTAL